MPWNKTTTLLSAALLLTADLADAQTASPTAGQPSTQVTAQRSTVNQNTYADGTYTATGWYGGLPSSITVTLTLAQGVIRNVQVQTHATDPTSLDYQRRFAAAVPRVVIGKPIAQVKVGKLAGASGTPDGFNDALTKIKAQASK